MILSSSDLMRRADARATECGVPEVKLMEAASAQLAQAAMRLALENRTVCIFSGTGSNGGDGIGAAAELIRGGYAARVYLLGSREKMTASSLEMARRYESLGGELLEFSAAEEELKEKLSDAGVIIDAIFGIGFRGRVEGEHLRAIEIINAASVPIVAADIPSGVAADTGLVLGSAVKASETVTFSMAMPGHFVEPGCTYCGKVSVADIAVPAELLKEAQTKIGAVLDEEIFLPRRAKLSHKGDFGRLLVIGGSVGYTGAPSLCARAAVRMGAGLVWLGVPQSIYEITAVKNDEAMPFPLDGGKDGELAVTARSGVMLRLCEVDAGVIGPGFGRRDAAVSIVQRVVRESAKPVVVDADALFALAQDMTALSDCKAPQNMILTPHEGEFLRMGGDLSLGRLHAALCFVRQYKCVLVLKGHRTIVAFPDETAYIMTRGNPGMAKGGTGDTLAGMIGAAVCQVAAKKSENADYEMFKRAIVTAVQLHAAVGDACCEELGEYSMTASDMIEKIASVTKRFVS